MIGTGRVAARATALLSHQLTGALEIDEGDAPKSDADDPAFGFPAAGSSGRHVELARGPTVAMFKAGNGVAVVHDRETYAWRSLVTSDNSDNSDNSISRVVNDREYHGRALEQLSIARVLTAVGGVETVLHHFDDVGRP
jgi:hypothetical protein